jgi:hypothetical protein
MIIPEMVGRVLLTPVVEVEGRVSPVGPVRFVGDGSGGSVFRVVDAVNVPLVLAGVRLVVSAGERWSVECCAVSDRVVR